MVELCDFVSGQSFVQFIEQGVHQLQLSVDHIALLDAAEMTSSSIPNCTTDFSVKGVPLLDELHEGHLLNICDMAA